MGTVGFGNAVLTVSTALWRSEASTTSTPSLLRRSPRPRPASERRPGSHPVAMPLSLSVSVNASRRPIWTDIPPLYPSVFRAFLNQHSQRKRGGGVKLALMIRAMTTETLCDLEHGRNRQAVVHVVVRSSRVGRPGRPMERDLLLCAAHARELRELGIDVIAAK